MRKIFNIDRWRRLSLAQVADGKNFVFGRHPPIVEATILFVIYRGDQTPSVALAAGAATGVCRATIIEFMVRLGRVEPAVGIAPVVQPFLICLQFPGQAAVRIPKAQMPGVVGRGHPVVLQEDMASPGFFVICWFVRTAAPKK